MTYIIEILLYIGFIIIYLLLPGVSLVPTKNRATLPDLIPLAFTMSCAILISAYFISFFFKSVLPLLIIPLIFVLISIIRTRGRIAVNFQDISRVLSGKEVLLLGLILFYVFCFSICPNFQVTANIPKYYHVDQMWHMGNVNMFSHFAIEDVRCSGITFRYHYFNDVLIACAKLVTGVSTFNLVFYYFPITVVLMLFFTLKSVAVCFLEDKYRLLFIWLVIGSTCASSLLCLMFKYGLFLNPLSLHLYTNINAVACGFVFMLSYVLVLFKDKCYQHESLGIAVLLSAIIVLTTGTKGPFGFMLTGATLFSYLVLFLRRESRCWKVPLLCGISFVIIYLVLLAGGEGSLSISPGSVIRSTAIFYVIDLFGFNERINYVLVILSIPFYLALLFCGASVFYYVSLINQAKLFPRNTFQNLFFHGITAVGLFFFLTLGHWGHSELYFFFGTIPFIAVLGLKAYQRFESKAVARYVFLVGFCVGVSSPLFSSLRIVIENRDELANRFFASKSSRMEIRSDRLTFEEKEGLEWLKKNSAPSDLFLTNKIFLDYPSNQDPRWFCYSAFSERSCFLEGYGYAAAILGDELLEQKKKLVNDVYFDGNEKFRKLLRDKGIRYIVERKDQKTNRGFSCEISELRFSNSRINIYQIK